jgi:hypothetical protein
MEGRIADSLFALGEKGRGEKEEYEKRPQTRIVGFNGEASCHCLFYSGDLSKFIMNDRFSGSECTV